MTKETPKKLKGKKCFNCPAMDTSKPIALIGGSCRFRRLGDT